MEHFDFSQIADPGTFAQNRRMHHADYVWYRNEKEAEEKISGFRLSLDGIWKFYYAENIETIPKDFFAEDFDCSGWKDIRVPSHIQLEGYGKPHYVNVSYPWEGHEELTSPEIPKKRNPAASYVTTFLLPEDWKGRRVFLSLTGAESAAAVWLNGSYIGYSGDSFSPADFELTKMLAEGENKLAVTVFSVTAGSWCEDQDFFRFSGLYRSVFLYTIPDDHIADFTVRALPSEDGETGSLSVDFRFESGIVGKELAKRGSKLVIQCFRKGTLLFEERREIAKDRMSFVKEIENPSLWSAEKPELYELWLKVLDSEGKTEEVIRQNAGFRRFEIKDGLMCLNGKRIVFRGINRHEFDHITGRCMTYDEVKQDLLFMKRNNINAVRTSHYPNDWMLYELCDELGIYLIAETNLETHGTWEGLCDQTGYETVIPGDHTEWLPMLSDRVQANYVRNKNHPSILIWSIGNESFGGSVLAELANELRRLDSTRLVHYEGIFRDRRYPDTSDMESQMYSSVRDIEAFLAAHPEKPFISCEYSHAMGNSCGSMKEYTELSERAPRYQGGFLWDFVDQAIEQRDRNGNDFEAYGGDFDDRPTDYNFCGDGILYADRTSSPKVQEVKYLYQDIRCEITRETIHVKNLALYTNTGEYQAVLTLQKNGEPFGSYPLVIQVEPLSEQDMALPEEVQEILKDEESEYTVTVSFLRKEGCPFAEKGEEAAFSQAVFGHYKDVRPVIRQKETAAKASALKPQKMIISHSSRVVGVSGSDFEVLFSYKQGLVSFRYAGKEMIAGIPQPNFWRAPTDNDRGSSMPFRCSQWKTAGNYAVLADRPVTEENAEQFGISYRYQLATEPASFCEMKWTVRNDGTISLLMDVFPDQRLSDMPEIGVMMKLPADYDHVKWYGLGPEETYADRKSGAKLGIFRNMVTNNLADYLVPQECGNHEGVRFAEITDKKGRGIRVTGENLNVSVLPYTPHEIENASHKKELPPVNYTVLRVAKAQMGIGGDDSWGALPHEEFLLPVGEPVSFSFRFYGI